MKRSILSLQVLVILAACKGEIVEQGVLVTVDNKSGVKGIVRLRAVVANRDRSETLSLPDAPGSPITFPVEFSISVPSSLSGRVDINVFGIDPSDVPVASGASYANLQGGTFVRAVVNLQPCSNPCSLAGDAGVSSDVGIGMTDMTGTPATDGQRFDTPLQPDGPIGPDVPNGCALGGQIIAVGQSASVPGYCPSTCVCLANGTWGGSCTPCDPDSGAPPTDAADTARRSDSDCTQPAPSGSCDPLTNQGCPSDKKCTALRHGNTLFLGCGGKGDKRENDDCQPTPDTGTQTGDDCGDGLACFNWAGESPKCHKICARSGCSSGCAEGWTCSRGLPGISSYWSCVASCKPLEQSGCQPGQACYVASNGPGCAETGSKATGDECYPSKVNDCQPGSTCITGLSNGNRCVAFCSTSGGEPKCSGTCNKIPVEDAVMSQPNVGYCR